MSRKLDEAWKSYKIESKQKKSVVDLHTRLKVFGFIFAAFLGCSLKQVLKRVEGDIQIWLFN